MIAEPAQLPDIFQKLATEGEGYDVQAPCEQAVFPGRRGHTLTPRRCHCQGKHVAWITYDFHNRFYDFRVGSQWIGKTSLQ